MPQKCSVCNHPKRLQIEQALISGDSLRSISGQFGPSKNAIARHRPHVSDAIVRSNESREIARSATLLDDVQTGRTRAEDLYHLAASILSDALKKDDQQTALVAIKSAVSVLKEARGYMELSAQITGQFQQNPRHQVTIVMPAVVPSQEPVDSYPAITIASPRR
jgi:hypothetical protein